MKRFALALLCAIALPVAAHAQATPPVTIAPGNTLLTVSADGRSLRTPDLARTAGLDGVVCSGHEVAAVHASWKDGFLVVPGLRPAGTSLGDQKRAVTPSAAREAGASVLVIGRPITRADDPVAAARAIGATL